MTMAFLPPKNWQDFEILTKDVAKYKLAGDFDNYGRIGQGQKGVDVFGWDINGRKTGLQCKHKSSAKARSKKIVTEIKPEIIDKEVSLADKFKPQLDVFIIATTSFRDTGLQDHVNHINAGRMGGTLPKIILWTWEVFEEEIGRHSVLQYIYQSEVLRAFDQYNKDKHILLLLKHALDRPAFNTEFHVENNCSDFLKAISDTQMAFTTGRLNDREGNPVFSAYPSKDLASAADRKNVLDAQVLLQDIRDFVTNQIRVGNIIQGNSFLEFRHDKEERISEYLNKTRAQVIGLVNKALSANALEPIDSNLVRRFGRV